jgi:hypothetical protein
MAETMNPAAHGGASRARKSDCLAAVGSENNRYYLDLQAFRARHLARRYRLAATAAGLVAGLHFGEGAR